MGFLDTLSKLFGGGEPKKPEVTPEAPAEEPKPEAPTAPEAPAEEPKPEAPEQQ